MSDIYWEGQHGLTALSAGVVVDLAEDSIDRVTELLAGVRGGVQKAVGSALSRATAAGKTTAKNAVAKEYTISQGEFLSQTKTVNHFVREADGTISVAFGFRGNVIPLMHFRTRVDRNGRVTTQVKRNSAAVMLERAFRAQIGGHTGIYERIGTARFPVEELYGPATPQMMYSDEAVTDAIEDKMAETYEKRLDHEILRLLNGWGR